MISISHWGLFPLPQTKFSPAWYDEQRQPQYDVPAMYYDARYLHG